MMMKLTKLSVIYWTYIIDTFSDRDDLFNIAKLNSNYNSTTTSTWVENSIDFILVHPPTHHPPPTTTHPG